MKHPASVIAILIAAVLSCEIARAQLLPAIPPSGRILTTGDVKNYWLNTLQNQPVPPKPTGLHPERQAGWQRDLDSRESMIRSIRKGDRNIDAKVAELTHNAEAWRRQGNEKEAEAAETKLREIRRHLALLETLELQRQAARSQIDAAERLKGIEARIAELRASCD